MINKLFPMYGIFIIPIYSWCCFFFDMVNVGKYTIWILIGNQLFVRFFPPVKLFMRIGQAEAETAKVGSLGPMCFFGLGTRFRHVVGVGRA